MWEYLSKAKAGRAMILTTHSMEEADALSDQIGIMIRGELRALGPSQALKSRHGEGYQVQVRLGGDGLALHGQDALFEGVTAALATLSSNVKQEASATAVKRFEVPSNDADLAAVFELLNTRSEELSIVDFSVTQTTLEDVFLKFARLQSDDRVSISSL